MRKIAVFTYGIRCVFYGNTDGRMNNENGDAEYSALRANLDANIEATRGASVWTRIFAVDCTVEDGMCAKSAANVVSSTITVCGLFLLVMVKCKSKQLTNRCVVC